MDKYTEKLIKKREWYKKNKQKVSQYNKSYYNINIKNNDETIKKIDVTIEKLLKIKKQLLNEQKK
jgi:hypothetical protein